MKCIKMLTFISLDEIADMEKWDDSRINEKKEILAFSLTALVHGEEEASKAKSTATAIFSGSGDDANMPSTELDPADIPDDGIQVAELMVLCKLAKSKGEAKRLIEQGGVSVDGQKVTDLFAVVSKDDLKNSVKLQKGKKIFHKAMLK